MSATSPALTASQTVGPFFHNCLLREGALITDLAGEGAAGQRVRIVGRVLDGDGAGVPDAMVEIWQANAHGRYQHPADARDLPLDPAFAGYGRSGTDAQGAFFFDTVKPGRVPFDGERLQAPHICVAICARGLLNHLFTRIYFADEPDTPADPILLHVPAERRATLIAARAESAGESVYRFDIVLQGAAETAFFNFAGGAAR